MHFLSKSFSGPYFPVFGLNIQTKYDKIRPRKTPYLDIFNAVPLAKSIKVCDGNRFPNLHILLKIACTFPITSVEC